ncbi:nucleotidyltransferase domain-containing protein [Spirosoma pulveris]
MTIQDLRDRKLILFECISGSRAYGTDLPASDTDIRGVFMLPQADLYGLRYVEQVNDTKNDIIFYELRRFIELLAKNNPNILELLCAPNDCILQKHPLFDQLRVSDFLSRLCRDTFAGYAASQIKKARGLNKKIVNPLPKERKSLLHFCYIIIGQKSIPVLDWLSAHNRQAAQCGLVSIPHARDMYALFYDENASLGFQGLISDNDSTAVSLSSVPLHLEPVALLSVNQDGYSSYCKDYREYWDWVEKRNAARYENTVEHGKNYDAKNMMHTFRLLDMALEILQTGRVVVRRPNREELLAIRSGAFDYEELLAQAEEKLQQIDAAAQTSLLPAYPDIHRIEQILVRMRTTLYETK